MLYNIANNKDRAIFTILVLLVALFSTKAQAEHKIPFRSSETINSQIYFSGKYNLGDLKDSVYYSRVESTKQYMCPEGLRRLITANRLYREALEALRSMSNNIDEYYEANDLSKLGADNLLDSETPKLKKLNEGLYSKAMEELEKSLDKTGLMLLDGCSAEEHKCVPVMGGQECYYTVKVSPQELIKNAEKYLK